MTDEQLTPDAVARGWRSGVLTAPVTVDPFGNFGRMDTRSMFCLDWWLAGGATFTDTTDRAPKTEADQVRAAVLAAVQAAEHESLRWEAPIEPELTCAMVRAALGVPGCGCGCSLCEGAADRWQKHRGTRAPWLPKEAP